MPDFKETCEYVNSFAPILKKNSAKIVARCFDEVCITKVLKIIVIE